jgi:hypothetical protein
MEFSKSLGPLRCDGLHEALLRAAAGCSPSELFLKVSPSCLYYGLKDYKQFHWAPIFPIAIHFLSTFFIFTPSLSSVFL